MAGVSALGPTIGGKQTTAAQSAGGFWNSDTGTVNLLNFYAGSAGTQVGSIKGSSTGVSLLGTGGEGLTVYGNEGNVGIGTSSPVRPLSVKASQEQLTLSEGDARGATFDYRSSTGNLNIATNGINARTNPQFTLDLNGNVGIGTSSPLAKLHVNAGEIRIASSAAYNTHFNYLDGGSNIISQANGGSTEIRNSSSSLFYLNASGKVGIGTTSVNEMLQIDSADSAIRVNTTNAVNNSELQLVYNNTTNGMFFRYHPNTALAYIDNTYPRTQAQAYGDILFRQSYAGTMTEHMRLTAYDGYLGVFTANPKARLELNLHSGADSALMNTNSVNDVQLLRAGFGQNAATTSNAGAKWGLRFVGRNDNTFDNGKSGAIYGVSEDSLGYNRKVGLAFHTSAFDAAHTERMRISSDGNVGIGDTNPQEKLQINGNLRMFSAGYPLIDIGITTSNYFRFVHDNPNDIFKIGKNGAATLNIAGSGNVGIGTTSPDTLLHLSNNGTTPATIRIERNDNTISDTNIYGGIEFEGQDASAASAAGIRGKILGVAEGSTGEMALTFQTAGSYGSSTERMRIDSSGNVGIGTINPQTALHIYDTPAEIVRMQGNDEYAYASFYGTVSASEARLGYMGFANDTSTAADFNFANTQGGIFSFNSGIKIKGASSTNYLQFNNSSDSEIFRIDSNFRWGWGTTTPSAVVHITGQNTAGLIVENGAGIASTQPYVSMAANNYSTGFGTFRWEDQRASQPSPSFIWEVHDGSGSVLAYDFRTGATGASGSKLAITQSGNVGISNSSPTSNLTIGSAQSDGLEFTFDGTNAYRNRIVNYWNSSTDTRMDFEIGRTGGVAPTALLSVGYNSKVGIGTITPQYKLDVVVDNNSWASFGRTISTSNYTGIHFGYLETGNTNYRKSAIVFERTDLTEGNAQGKVHILNGPQSGGGSATLSDAKFTIREDGNVGIGDTNPASQLEVNEGSNYRGVHVRGSNTPSFTMAKGTTSTPEWRLGISGYDGNDFAISTGSTVNDQMRMDPDGNVMFALGTANIAPRTGMHNDVPTLQTRGPLISGSSQGAYTSSARNTRDWFVYAGPSSNTGVYVHMKTDLWGGGSPNGNIAFTMSSFTYHNYYAYGGSWARGQIGWHNWQGSFYNVTRHNEGTLELVQPSYISSDGYVVLVARLDAAYAQFSIDWFQWAGYGFREAKVTAVTQHSSATGAY